MNVTITKKKNKGCLVGCLVVAVLFLICAAIGFFVLQTTIVNWYKKQKYGDFTEHFNQLTNVLERAAMELQAREQSGEPEPAEAEEE